MFRKKCRSECTISQNLPLIKHKASINFVREIVTRGAGLDQLVRCLVVARAPFGGKRNFVRRLGLLITRRACE